MARGRLTSLFGKSEVPLIIGHRGASAYYPENTLTSVEAAIRAGCDMVEVDTRITADNRFVIIHDADLTRISTRKSRISDISWDNLKHVDVGSWFHPKYASERVPTLQQLLDLCRGKIPVNIELKFINSKQSSLQKRIAAVAEIVEQHSMVDHTLISSFDSRFSPIVKQINPAITTAILYHSYYWRRTPPSHLIRLKHADFFHCSVTQHNEKWQMDLQKEQIPVNVYTVNQLATFDKMRSLGVSGVFSDRPDVLINHLSKHT